MGGKVFSHAHETLFPDEKTTNTDLPFIRKTIALVAMVFKSCGGWT
jgi:hypothetical protein